LDHGGGSRLDAAVIAIDRLTPTDCRIHRTVRSKGCLSNKTALAMIFKLAEAAEKSWPRLDGHNQLSKIILGVGFTDGIEVVKPKAQAARLRIDPLIDPEDVGWGNTDC
jgi:hypothetical protein